MPSQTPVRLIAGALSVLAAVQVATVASRIRGGPEPFPAGLVSRLASPPAGAVEVRLRRLDAPVGAARLAPPHRAVRLAGGAPLPTGNRGAAVAVRAALSMIGTPYVWAGAGPGGFDCSGLTMWAWAHAGVTLPHSSRAQYAALPHVAREDLRPGDLLFFYSPISHVSIYLGNGMMVDALTSGSSVGVRAVWWDTYVGAARPG